MYMLNVTYKNYTDKQILLKVTQKRIDQQWMSQLVESL